MAPAGYGAIMLCGYRSVITAGNFVMKQRLLSRCRPTSLDEEGDLSGMDWDPRPRADPRLRVNPSVVSILSNEEVMIDGCLGVHQK